jgi:hypothetical protein
MLDISKMIDELVWYMKIAKCAKMNWLILFEKYEIAFLIKWYNKKINDIINILAMFRIKNMRGATVNKASNLSPNLHQMQGLKMNNNALSIKPISIK